MADLIPQDSIEEIRRRNDVVEVVAEYLPLKGSGGNYKALCPFHSEKTPSFTVTRQKQIFHCFGCGVGGNVFHFVMKYEHMSFPEAVAHLAKRAGVALPKSRLSAPASPLEAHKEQLYRMNELAASYFHQLLLNSPQGEKAREQKRVSSTPLGPSATSPRSRGARGCGRGTRSRGCCRRAGR